jgi:hypothetical protein
MAIRSELLDTITELRDIYMLERDWKSYLSDKTYKYSDVEVITQKKKLLSYVDCGLEGHLDTLNKDPRAPLEKREKELTEICSKHGISFKVNTEYKYSEPYEKDNETYRTMWIHKDGDFVMPASLSTKLLHYICDRNYDNLVGRLISGAYKLSEDRIPDEEKRIIGSAVDMICDDARNFQNVKPDKDEYIMKVIVNENDFRYTEPNDEVSGIIFKNAGMAALKGSGEKDFFAGLVLRKVYEILKEEPYVLDVYMEATSGSSLGGCEANLLIMYN